MASEDISPYISLIIAPCIGGFIIFSLFAISLFLGFLTNQIWNISEYPKGIRIILIVIMALFPEIGILGWAIYFGRSYKIIFRVIAFISGGIYLLLQIGFLFSWSQDDGLITGLVFTMLTHFIWSPFILFLGAVSFFVFRSIPFSGINQVKQ